MPSLLRVPVARCANQIADKVGCYLMCDMAHFSGLVAAKVGTVQ